MRIGVLGGGSWGTALAKLLVESDHQVVMWVHNPAVARDIAEQRENRAYLPGFWLPAGLQVTNSMPAAVGGRELLVAVCPSHAMRDVMQAARPYVEGVGHIVSASKGIEEGTLQRMSEVIVDVLGQEFSGRVASLSGPSFARDVATGMPTAVTAASPSMDTAAVVQRAFNAPAFRVYTSTDLVGVEVGGAAKNVIAIAAGVNDGLGFGDSSRAALITRGVAEVGRLVAKMGGIPQTVSGLSGLGDMVLTCTGNLSRNRTVGVRIGKGERLADITASMKMIAEGVKNSISVCELARHAGVEMPITEQIRLMLHEDKPAYQVLGDLMRRPAKPEFIFE